MKQERRRYVELYAGHLANDHEKGFVELEGHGKVIPRSTNSFKLLYYILKIKLLDKKKKFINLVKLYLFDKAGPIVHQSL